MRRKELGKNCYMILISNLNVVVLRVECQRLDITGREVQQPSWQTVRASRCSPCWCGTSWCQPSHSISPGKCSKYQTRSWYSFCLLNKSDVDMMKMRGNENLIDHFFNFCICWPVVRLPVGVQQETHLWIQTVKVLVVFNTFSAILFHRSHFVQWNPKGLKLFSCIPPVLSIAESTNYKWWWEWKGRMQYVTNLEHSSFLLYNQGRGE